MSDFIILAILVNSVIFGGFCAYLAGEKGRSSLNWFLLGALFSFIALIALVAIPKIETAGEAPEASAPIQEKLPINKNKRVMKFEDEMNISKDKYIIFLTKHFGIDKNTVLNKYIVGDNLFDTIELALEYADEQYKNQIAVDTKKYESNYSAGFKIQYINPETVAARSDLKVGDILVQYGDVLIIDDASFDRALSSSSGSKVNILVFREGTLTEMFVNSGRLGVVGGITNIPMRPDAN
jgi:hypothetical protein